MRGGLHHASGVAARTEAAAFVAERHQLLVPEILALDAQESVFEAPAFEVRFDHFFGEAGQRDSLGFETFQKPGQGYFTLRQAKLGDGGRHVDGKT